MFVASVNRYICYINISCIFMPGNFFVKFKYSHVYFTTWMTKINIKVIKFYLIQFVNELCTKVYRGSDLFSFLW